VYIHTLHRQLATVTDTYIARNGTATRAKLLDLVDDTLARVVNDLTEDSVTAIEVRAGGGGDKELRAVGVGAAVRHGQEVSAIVLKSRMDFILEVCTIDRPTTRAIEVCDIATLAHEAWNDAVEDRVAVAQQASTLGLDTSTELPEVLTSLGCSVAIKTHVDRTDRLAVDINAHVHSIRDFVGPATILRDGRRGLRLFGL